ncbi:MAG: hypothetical protein J0H80_07245, partial [Rhizobiales bacterium]|nr:hypothetical protein [Hyphomicrobiales bacterium]
PTVPFLLSRLDRFRLAAGFCPSPAGDGAPAFSTLATAIIEPDRSAVSRCKPFIYHAFGRIPDLALSLAIR